MKLAAAALLVALGAPMQCGSHDPDLRVSDNAGDALWDLAATFDEEGNGAARDRTLRYLITTYPSNRHAPEARERLGAAK